MNTLEEALSETLLKLMQENMVIKLDIQDNNLIVELLYDGELIDDETIELNKEL